MDKTTVEAALATILEAFADADPSAWRKIAADLARQKDLKPAFQPLKRVFEDVAGRASIVQTCLDQAEDHPLHVAAVALIARRVVDWPIYLPIATDQPARSVDRLVVSSHAPKVFAFEQKVLSIWSTETGNHLADFKFAKSQPGYAQVVYGFHECEDGRLRLFTRAGGVQEAKPGGPFKVVVSVESIDKAAANADVSIVAFARSSEVVDKDGPCIRAWVHRPFEGQKTEVFLPLTESDDWQLVDDATVVVSGMRHYEDGRAEPKLVLIDLRTASVESIPLPREATALASDRPHCVLLHEYRGDQSTTIYDLSTRERKPYAEPTDRGLVYDQRTGEFKKDGETAGFFFVHADANQAHVAFDSRTKHFVFAIQAPKAPVQVAARFLPG